MVKDKRIINYFYTIALSILLFGAHIASANGIFQNSLIRMEFSKTSSGGIKINLFTGKPYKDAISVNKRSDFEYIILMPETSNSMTADPILNPVIGIVKGVSIKTQPYDDQVKGYTKISIKTLKPVEITTQIKTLNSSDYLLSDNDYKELLSQTTKINKAQAKNEIKQPILQKKEILKPVTKQKMVLPPVVGESKKNIKKSSSVALSSNVNSEKVIHQSTRNFVPQSKAISKPKITVKQIKKSQFVPKEVEKTAPLQESQDIATPTVTEKNIPETIDESKITEPEIQTQNQSQLEPVSQTQQQPQSQTQVQALLTQKMHLLTNKVKNFGKYKNLFINNLYIIISAIFAIFIILLFGARKMAKNIKKQKNIFINNLEEKPASTPNFMDKINEDMTWKEKYNTFIEASNQKADAFDQTVNEQSSSIESNEELNELFSNEPPVDNFSERNIYSENFSENIDVDKTEIEQYDLIEKELLENNYIPQNEISEGDEVFGQDKLDKLFGEEEVIGEENNLIEDGFFIEESLEESKQEPADSAEIIKSEFAIDDSRGFYLVDFEESTALIGHIEDEIFVLKQFGEKVEGTLQARINEQKVNGANYMTRVGNFKALVEVTPNNMNLLIEL